MSIAIKKGQDWTDGVNNWHVTAIIGNKAYAKNLNKNSVHLFLYLNADNTPYEMGDHWKLVPGIQDPPTRFIIPSRLIK